MNSSGYPSDLVRYMPGRVEETLPGDSPPRIALLRLDTDFYDSTRHEMVHLYPRLVQSGVIIIDDYGFWKGAKQAADEYFAEHHIPILLNRMGYSARIGIKP